MGAIFHRGITRYLSAATFPAERDELRRAGEAAGAPPAVLAVIDRLDNRTYDGMAQVAEELTRLDREDEVTAAGRPSVDKLSEDSFPASDPPGLPGTTGVGKPPSS